ncbi:Clp protease N-terminal domain-containing protein [Streptomyces sp. NPDC013157]|uniref:Clp protease N-terminal domain-containing protein n=1 Tax=Streptomyces sp. NPDC013157 TaxID=3364861 RepID=UPI00367A82B0
MTLGTTRRLRAVLSDNSRLPDVLNKLGYGSIAERLPASTSLEALLSDAEHEARRRRHPYLASEHVLLAAFKAAGDRELITEYANALDRTPARVHRWWRPRGRSSALRTRGQRILEEQQRLALERERRHP